MKTTVLLAAALLATLSTPAHSSGGGSGNLGHRIGAGRGEAHADLPENSLIALEAALKGRDGREPIQFHERFEYMEFDVRETHDGHLVLMHDGSLSRTVPSGGVNERAVAALLADSGVKQRTGKKRPSFGDLSVEVLTLAQLKTLRFGEQWESGIPTLAEILDRSRAWGLRKPVAAEIKWIRTDAARRRYLEMLADFRETYLKPAGIIWERGYDLDRAGVSVFGFESALAKTFGRRGSDNRDRWCGEMRQLGFDGAFKPLSHAPACD